MLVLSGHRLVREKTERLMNGYSAFAETQDLIRLIEREITRHNLEVYRDVTENGCWFIPIESKEIQH
ncbi:hypothetical protein RZN22_05060 [Bacillaceae bacterium S4-13-58]